MSKAEERAFEYYPNIDRKDYPCKELDAAYREVFVLGYHQAEKDLELTWEDIRELYIIFAEVDVELDFYKTDIKTETLGYYQEILRRFKERKKK